MSRLLIVITHLLALGFETIKGIVLQTCLYWSLAMQIVLTLFPQVLRYLLEFCHQANTYVFFSQETLQYKESIDDVLRNTCVFPAITSQNVKEVYGEEWIFMWSAQSDFSLLKQCPHYSASFHWNRFLQKKWAQWKKETQPQGCIAKSRFCFKCSFLNELFRLVVKTTNQTNLTGNCQLFLLRAADFWSQKSGQLGFDTQVCVKTLCSLTYGTDWPQEFNCYMCIYIYSILQRNSLEDHLLGF